MPNIKTAVSIDNEIFRKAEKAAEELKISRSQLFEDALVDYLKLLEDKKILDKLNYIYSEQNVSEESYVCEMRVHHRNTVAKEEW